MMKKINQEESTAKAIRKRYASVLGLKNFPVENKTKKRTRHGPVLLFILLLAAVGSYFFSKWLDPNATDLTSIAHEDSLHQRPGREGTDLLTKHEVDPFVPHPVNSGLAEVKVHAGESAVVDKSLDFDVSQMPSPLIGAGPMKNDQSSDKPISSGTFFVVLLSTKSKGEALKQARELNGNGYACEVILSSTGYYGIVQRTGTYEQAKAALKALVASGSVKGKPYIMNGSRVKNYISP